MITSPSQEGSNGPTMEAVRNLIDRVTVTPVDSGKKRPLPHIYLRGDICAILGLTLGLDALPEGRKTSVYLEVRESRVFLVAGAGFEPAAFRL
jgi:site-specific DNA recombinase